MRTPPNERLTSDIAAPPASRTASGSEEARAHQSRHGTSLPERRCILTGESAPRATLLRLAISPEGQVLPDPLAKAPGRGAWLGVGRSELEAAMAKGRLKGALMRAFKGGPLTISNDLPQQIEDALCKTLLDRFGLAKRHGIVVLGAERIAEQCRKGHVAALLHAADAREDGRRRLDQAWRVGRDAEGSGERGITLPLDRAALSVALGRDNVVHLGVNGSGADKAAAEPILTILARLLHYMGTAHEAPPPMPRTASAARHVTDNEHPIGTAPVAMRPTEG